jgi:hypothetical protein
MKWFRKAKSKEAREIDDQRPVGDIATARKVREICNSVAGSTDRVAVLFCGPMDQAKKFETGRYDHARQRAEEQADKILDFLLRDAAIRQILDLCIKANDIEGAEALFDKLCTKLIREAVAAEHPRFSGWQTRQKQTGTILLVRPGCLIPSRSSR